jgi:hypothetical protein
MRKILAAFLLVTIAATASFATDYTATSGAVAATEAGKTAFPNVLGGTTVSTVAIGKLSTGVYLSWNVALTGYALATQHSSGVRTYGSASDSTAIMWHTAVKGAALAQPTASAATSFDTVNGGWSVM